MTERLAERSFEIALRNRVVFGAGAIERLPELIGTTGRPRAFVVTDPGVVASGVVDHVRDVLAAAGIPVSVHDGVEPNPGTGSILRGSAALVAFGVGDSAIVPVGGGSSMDSAKAIALHAANGGEVLALGYHRDDVAPGGPLIAVPTTAGTGAETNTYGVITDEAAGRKDYVGHPSLLPLATILDPELSLGLPPAATAATGVDAMTHSLESLLSANPNPFAEAIALGVLATAGAWLPRAVADGRDLEARSQMLLASHLAGVGQASGTGVGLVHALGHALGTRGRLAHGLALAVVLPEVLAFYADSPGLRDRELARVGVALRAASATEAEATAAAAAIGAVRRLLGELSLRPSLRSLGFDDATLDVVAQDAIDDAAIRNSPRMPTLAEARSILASVRD
ncbi:MAG TPA: iron-containing alcohol dehydrogenase [Candidatus Limnocylindrales bacterium]|nr:iron-containing alcohol dehydrogenase [Candidatus Limnocylindrales bacterium]